MGALLGDDLDHRGVQGVVGVGGGGAALDVTEIEPLPGESPLWTAPNLFITPHTSAISSRLWQRETDLLVQLLERWFDGRELFNLVDLNKGY